MTITAEPRLLANYNVAAGGWRIPEGSCEVAVGTSATTLGLRAVAALSATTL